MEEKQLKKSTVIEKLNQILAKASRTNLKDLEY